MLLQPHGFKNKHAHVSIPAVQLLVTTFFAADLCAFRPVEVANVFEVLWHFGPGRVKVVLRAEKLMIIR